ncbi:MAG: long-chain fatty acid--CoA ligase [Alphaproteobacteria bacterium]|nr:long-chain fatty acid--CoA ligase [Alphaproteobacteria bacterium]
MSIDYDAARSIPAIFLAQADQLGDKPFLAAKLGGAWRSISWAEARDRALALASGLKGLGLTPGDRVMLVSENRPEWAIADLAIMLAGGITVPAYVTNTAADHLHILTDSGARIILVSTAALAERVLEAAVRSARPPTIVCLDMPERHQAHQVTVLDWAETAQAEPDRVQQIRRQTADIRRDDVACLIYTSGTGGAPRGVMLSHGAMIADCAGAFRLLERVGLADEVFLSFLPLSHAYEHTVGLIFPITIGARIFYAEGLEQLAANMAEIRPTIMTAVPRLYESMRARILKAVARQGGAKAKLFHRAVDLGKKRYLHGRLGPLDWLADKVLDRLVRTKVAARFGGRLKALVSGGAPLAPEVGLFFTALGVPILQGYGQTEAGPAISCSPPDRIRIETVGPPLAGIELAIAEDGEILVRGEVVMTGYWNDPAATARTIDTDGWLKTGDIGKIDPDGYLRITDRKKDIIVNSGGDNVSPQRVEGLLTLRPEIAQAMVHGDRRPHLVAVLVPDGDWAAQWARDNGQAGELAEWCALPAFRRAVADAVDHVNAGLSPIEKVRRFVLCAEPFTTDNGMMTPTLKVRRHVVRERFGAQLEALYHTKSE